MRKLKNTYQRILEYLKGNFSNKERHILEKEALDDPFLQDALDGFETIETDVLENDIKRLNTQIQFRTEKKERIIPLFYYPIAASLLVLFGFSIWWFKGYQNLEKPQEIVNTEIEEEQKQPQFVDRSKEVEISSDVAFEEIEETVVDSKRKIYRSVPKPSVVNKKTAVPTVNNDSEEILDEAPSFSDIEEEVKEVPEITTELTSATSSNQRIEKLQSLSSAKATIDRSVASEVEANEKTNSLEKKQDFKRITKNKDAPPDVNAIPFNGSTTDFKEWIKQNLNPNIIDKLTKEKAIINISFLVSEFGNLYQVRFDTTLDKITKKELRSIIKSSPKWQPAKLKGVSTSDKVQLKLMF